MQAGWIAIIALLAVSPAVAKPPKDNRLVIHSQQDLPDTRFVLDGPASTAYSGQAFLSVTVPTMRAEAERLLGGYRIDDPQITQRLRIGLAAIAILQDRPADAQTLIAQQRPLETKAQLRAIGFMTADSIAAGQLARGDCSAVAARLTTLLAPADPVLVRDEVLTRYSRVETASVGYFAGAAAGVVEPEQQTRGSIGLMDGLLMATWRVEADKIPLCRDAMAQALKTWLDDPAHMPVDVWTPRLPKADTFAGAPPVTVAIWESGFDAQLFPGQIAIDPAEPLDGVDNDGNGVIDDTFGPTYDYQLRPTRSTLPPPSPWMAARLGLQMAVEKGQTDLNYGDDTSDARFFAARGRDAALDEQIDDVRGADEFRARSHATWVAGIVAKDAPYIRLFTADVYPFGAWPDPQPVLEEDIDRWIALLPMLAQRMRGAHVRVVNVSWKLAPDDFAGLLLQTGAESDPKKAQARGAVMQIKMRKGLTDLINACPDVLFVMAAGNNNESSESLGAIPQTLNLPNMIVVGATGMNGRPTVFTTYGKPVRFYAPGEGIAVLTPGGMVMRSSGTSFAAPAASRTAAQMLAVNPKLTPAQLIEGLDATASVGEADLRLIDPAKAVVWAKAR